MVFTRSGIIQPKVKPIWVKSYMSFRLVPKSVTLNDLERRNGVILRYFSEFW